MPDIQWIKLNKLIEQCYDNMIGANPDDSCWWKAFDELKKIILKKRKEDPSFCRQIEMIDEETDYQCDIQGWLEDCLDELDMREEYEILLSICTDLLRLFEWPDYTDSDICFMKASSLRALGRVDEAVKFCCQWLAEESENPVAAASGIYSYIKADNFTEAEKLVEKFISDEDECDDENYVVFNAASKLYETKGDLERKQHFEDAMQNYDKALEEELLSDLNDIDDGWDDDWDDDWDEDSLPFG